MIKTGFKSTPKLNENAKKHYKHIVKMLQNNDIEYTQDHELAVIQLAKSLDLADLYENAIIEHGVIINDGSKLRTNPATVSLASTKGSINALMVQLMLTPKSQGLSVVVPEELSDDEKVLKEMGLL